MVTPNHRLVAPLNPFSILCLQVSVPPWLNPRLYPVTISIVSVPFIMPSVACVTLRTWLILVTNVRFLSGTFMSFSAVSSIINDMFGMLVTFPEAITSASIRTTLR